VCKEINVKLLLEFHNVVKLDLDYLFILFLRYFRKIKKEENLVKIAQTKIRCTHVSQTSLGEELIFAPKYKKK
jgi:hypothetical protein